MQRRTTAKPVPPEAQELRRQIEQWRKTRKNLRVPMPEHLWAKSVGLARDHSVYSVAQMLGVNYENLKRRTATTETHQDPAPSVQTTFVELTPVQPMHRHRLAPEGCVIELRNPQGARLTLRLPSDGDVAQWLHWVDALWNRRA